MTTALRSKSIYILSTPKGSGREFRVANLSNVENIAINEKGRIVNGDHELMITNAREMWKDSPVFNNSTDVRYAANRIRTTRDAGPFEYNDNITIVVEKEF